MEVMSRMGLTEGEEESQPGAGAGSLAWPER